MNKKYLKFNIIGTIFTSGVIFAAFSPTIFSAKIVNQSNRITESNQKASDGDYGDELEYIKRDAEKQGNVDYSVASIKLVGSTSASNLHSAAIVTKTDDSTLLYMWGKNDYGQLGFTANSNPNSTPTLVKTTHFSSSPIKQVALGSSFSAALLDDGSLYTWGQNNYGQLGFESSVTPTPTKINSTFFGNKKVDKIAFGAFHSAAILEDGSLYMWGNNVKGQLGVSRNSGSNNPNPAPIIVPTTFTSPIKQLELGEYYSAAVLDDGSLYTWGQGGHGQLGNNSTVDVNNTLKMVDPVYFNSKKVTQIAVSKYITAILTEDNKIYLCGLNQNGIFGVVVGSKSIPTLFDTTIFGSNKIIQIALGDRFAGALLEDGSLYMWGGNGSGQLGFTANSIANPTPTKVDSKHLNNKKIKQVMLSNSHSIAILEDDTIYAWGYNQNGQLGDGSTTSKSIPTWLSKLGKDSHIIANSTLTSKEATDNMWVNNSFNLTGFKNSFDLYNIPDNSDQTFTMAAKPTYDNQTGTLTMKVGIKYFYDQNGLGVANTAATAMVFNVFMPSLTKISVKTNPRTDVVIDKWLESVKELTYIDRQKLEDYLLLEHVPQYAVFTITGMTQNLQTGVLKFNITSSLTTKQDGSQTGESETFAITLNLTPRVTTLTTRTDYNKIAVDKLKDLIFDTNGVATDGIKKFIKYNATVDGATLNLKPNSYVINTGMGTVTFTIFFDKYYAADGSQKSQTATSLTQSYVINLQLLPMKSVITSKASYTPTHRVDRFISTFTNASGNVTNETILKQYVDIQNLPTGYTLKLSEVNIINPIEGLITFNVIASKYNDENFTSQIDGVFPIQLKLLPKYLTTNIQAKAEGEYDYDLRADRFVAYVTSSDGKINQTKLAEFLEIDGVPNTAEVTLTSVLPNTTTGSISFIVNVSQYYNNDSDLVNAKKTFPISLKLGIKYSPTQINAVANVTDAERIDRFEKEIKRLSGTPELRDYLDNKYITITGGWWKTAILSVGEITTHYLDGTIKFDLIVSQHYDINSDLVEDSLQTYKYPFPINLKVTPNANATTFIVKPTLPKNILVHELTAYLTPNGITDISRFNQYVDIVSLPAGTNVVLDEISHSTTTGKIVYDVILNQYYDGEGDLQPGPKVFPITLQLDPVNDETKIYALPVYPLDLTVADFKLYVNDGGIVNIDNLKKFVSVESLPTTSSLTITWGAEKADTIDFVIHASQYYNANHRIANNKDYSISLTFANNVLPTVIKPWDEYQHVPAHEFFNTVNPNNVIDYAILSKYLDLTTVPHNATLSINNERVDPDTGLVTFDITTTIWYDENKQLIMSADTTHDISLNLEPKFIRTNLFGISLVKYDTSIRAFWLQISTGNQLDISKLAHYVNLDTLVPNSDLQYLNAHINSDKSGISFDLVVNRFYEADGVHNFGRKVFRISLKYAPPTREQLLIDNNIWIYVASALSISTTAGLMWFLFVLYKKRKK